jgi:allantoicase
VADFSSMPDLACRDLGGSVVFATDELFAEKENLIKAGPAGHVVSAFGNKGKVYDGWETRRRREPGSDEAVVRLGCSGIVHGVVVDTAFFRGNFPPEISVEAACMDGYPSPAELAGQPWHTLVERTAAKGDTINSYPVADRHRWTHVRLSIYPDGGVARFRVHGEVVPDPDFMTGTVDLAAMENGGRVVDCSDAFYASPSNLIMPGRARVTSDGWENARRRGPGNDYVVLRLAAPGVLRHVEIDTSCFIGNAPGWVSLSGANAQNQIAVPGTGPGEPAADAGLGDLAWQEILPEIRIQPDTRQRFAVAGSGQVTHLRLDVVPDGGMARFRAWGEVAADALDVLRSRWL